MAEKKPAPKAQPQAAPKPAAPPPNQPKKKGRTSPRDLPPAGTNGIESQKTITRWFGLGGRETHTTFAPSTPRVPATERFKAKGAPTQPAPVQPPKGRVPATERFKAKPAKGTIFDNDIAEHRRTNGLPPKPPRGQAKGGPAKGGPAKGGGPSR